MRPEEVQLSVLIVRARAVAHYKGDPAYVATCAPGAAITGKIAAIKSPKKQTANALLECSYPKTATIEILPGTTSSTMNVVSNKEMVTTIVLGQTSSTATYNSKYCKSKPAIASPPT